MNNIYKTLIVLTFLICSFFLAKYEYTVWPRYEWREKIVIYDYFSDDYENIKKCDYGQKHCEDYCQDITIKYENRIKISEEEWDKLDWDEKDYQNSWLSFDGEQKYYKIEPKEMTKEFCYKKERVKVN